MRWTAGLLIRRSMSLRLLLVAALAVGLSAMHVLAGGSGQQQAQARGHLNAPVVAGTPSAHGAMAVDASTVDASQTLVSPTWASQVSDHVHHPSVDCVLFLSAGVAMLGVLLAWVAARALRPSSWPADPWLATVMVSTPWRGPPPWRWPRIRLCVIRV
ncbi:hypothetical protein [Kineococcus rubinsiae]|uniref:hypothetical protein n=1 Tax=Kineococcus rubinsiae TaxID=2609562 RepID=UPI001430003E|nr:hypothetical protein [Kineococcus rubinsiae]NIZ91718.1 hypothetical protein [Kineococcus rubinsiae]